MRRWLFLAKKYYVKYRLGYLNREIALLEEDLKMNIKRWVDLMAKEQEWT